MFAKKNGRNLALFVGFFLTFAACAVAQQTPDVSLSDDAKSFAVISGTDASAKSVDVESYEVVSKGSSSFSTVFGSAITSTEVAAHETEGGKALRVSVLEKTPNFWDTGVGIEVLPGTIAQGDEIAMTLRARSVRGPGLITVAVQRAVEPYEHLVSEELTLTPEWEEYTITGTSGLSLGTGEVGVAVLTGYGVQTIELGQFEVRKASSVAEAVTGSPAPADANADPAPPADANAEDANQEAPSFKSFISAVNSVVDIDLAHSFSLGNEDIASSAFEPAIMARYDKWEAEIVGIFYYDSDDKADFQPDFTYRLGWISYDPNSFSLFYENFDANRFIPDDGERFSRIERGQVVLGFRFRIDDEFTQSWTGLDNHMNCDAETRWVPRFLDLDPFDVNADHKVILSMDCKYKIMGGLFVRGEALFYPVKGQQQVFDPDFTYSFGYDTDQRNSLALEYDNFTPNRYPGHDLDGEGSFKDGFWKLTYHLPF